MGLTYLGTRSMITRAMSDNSKIKANAQMVVPLRSGRG